jgi:uncharacterized protein YbaP (TraB family)
MKKSLRYLLFLLLPLFQFILLFQCVTQQDIEEPEVFTYINENIGIGIILPEEWNLYTNREEAPEFLKEYFREDKNPDESPLFIGLQNDQKAFVRCLIEKTDLNILDYFNRLYDYHADREIQVFRAVISEDKTTIVWNFQATKKLNLIFWETMAKQNDYVIRIGFWTFSPLKEKYQSLFQKLTEETSFKITEKGKVKWVKIWEELEDKLIQENIDFVKIASPEIEESSLASLESTPIFYQIKGKESTVSILGTIHMGFPGLYPLPEIIEQAFCEADYVVVEVNILSDETGARVLEMINRALLPNNQTIDMILSESLLNQLKSKLEEFGLPYEKLKQYQPWYIASILTTFQIMSLGYSQEYGVEQYYLNRIQEGQEILELESFDSQIEMLMKLDGEIFLDYTLLSLDSTDAGMKEILTAWQTGNEDNLERIIFDSTFNLSDDTGEFYRMFYYERNEVFARKILDFVRAKGNYFVLFGVGHLVGEGGVIQLLKGMGVNVVRY